MQKLLMPGLLLTVIVAAALLAPVLPLPDPVRQDVGARLAGPSLAHWAGQDEYGRDVLARLVWGARVSLSVAFAASFLAAIAGMFLGVLGGYFRGLVELATVRAAEVVLCFPPLLLALLVVTLLGPGADTLIFCLAILFAPGFARVAYAETLATRNLDYVTAQTSLGTPTVRILMRTLLPNIAAPLIVQFSLTIAAALLLESGLSFLGLGVVPPAPSWGLMIRSARATMEQAPLLLVWPCLALSGTVLILNLLCDRLRDVLDPRGSRARPGFLRTLAALPSKRATSMPTASGLLSVRGLTLEAPGPHGPIPVVRGVEFDVAPGETVAIVGESGSGKTLTGLAIMGLLPPAISVVSGEIVLSSRSGQQLDILRLREREIRALRGGDIAMVFQDPSSSLNPLHRTGSPIAESLRAHGNPGHRVTELLRRVGLPDPSRAARAYPHELSGGQRQRVMIATAIANHPRLLVADEPTTALDVTVQAQILDLLSDLKRSDQGMGMIFVSHNLAVVSEIADRVVVMYAGQVVEQGPAAEVFAHPHHPYTAALIASTPEDDIDRLATIAGAVPQPWALPQGCSFAPRCGHATPGCESQAPELFRHGERRAARCLRWREFA
ncbi:peptide/nickel transport system permease protein [Enhydrobacter aerosaccus]|uniref:Peptide/nickel transport system permease protein n=1 Tax=Enhydrobacter aerosaccus TaxID=225324 RepID=A0A1T4K6T8_9HYPH|nr:dipeptide/oligopeptide/nickel ABC transporter permease/ATP-binding protein [Enhydrobacter aerosaccus]SJZ38139.1 peptide/nickel transport system permease protein [Enhydrobacter aerosaccus]